MDAVFRALVDPNRRRLLDRLFADNGQTLNQLVEGMDMSRQAVMKHLALLEGANLVSSVRVGREKLHYLNPVPIAEVSNRWIGKYEAHRVAALNELKRGLTTPMSKPEFVYVVFIESTPEAVWQALTEPEFTQRYWDGRRIESDWQPGSTVRHLREDGNSYGEGEVLAANPPSLLCYTFHLRTKDGRFLDQPARVTFEIEDAGSAVKLTLKHEHSPDSPRRETMTNAWPAILSSLKTLLETGRPLPSLH